MDDRGGCKKQGKQRSSWFGSGRSSRGQQKQHSVDTLGAVSADLSFDTQSVVSLGLPTRLGEHAGGAGRLPGRTSSWFCGSSASTAD